MRDRRDTTVRLLVVDDAPADIELMTIAARLHDPPCLVDAVERGDDALALLARLRNPTREVLPDALLLDLRMPVPSGFEVLEAVRADPRLARMAVVVVTTSVRADDEARARALGVDAFHVKPDDLSGYEQMIAEVVALVGRRRAG
ncbi:MAG TPA: response regulator [Acidimicrobiales bacterium]|nr:response regulator [Acidimicrobiales bacterium]